MIENKLHFSIKIKAVNRFLPIADEIKVGYVDSNSKYNKLLQLLAALEKSLPNDIARLCNELKIVEQSLANVSLRSIIWANDMYRYIL